MIKKPKRSLLFTIDAYGMPQALQQKTILLFHH